MKELFNTEKNTSVSSAFQSFLISASRLASSRTSQVHCANCGRQKYVSVWFCVLSNFHRPSNQNRMNKYMATKRRHQKSQYFVVGQPKTPDPNWLAPTSAPFRQNLATLSSSVFMRHRLRLKISLT
jgi:hypothetical protein